MSSMMPIMLAICFMAATVCCTDSPPRWASFAACIATPSVSWALPALLRTASAIFCAAMLVSSALPALFWRLVNEVADVGHEGGEGLQALHLAHGLHALLDLDLGEVDEGERRA
jgi:hypothetical protein